MPSEIINQFKAISLNELNERAPLLNREDSKYIFHVSQLPHILQQCVQTYGLLNIDNTRIFNYRNWYYDTAGLLFYQQHHSGKANRCKIRKRVYADSGLHMMEIKFKTNKGKTKKYRHTAGNINAARHFIQQHSGYDITTLNNTLQVNYSRITMLHKTKSEKVTFDLNLNYSQNDVECSFNNLVIAEVKTEKCSEAVFKNLMKNLGIREDPFSKYCIGLIALHTQVKHNNFKQLYHKIQKINQHGIILQPSTEFN